MALIEQQTAILILEKHFPAFFGCVDGAWRDYLSYPIDKRVVHSSRSRASLVHDHMVDRAAKYAARESGVQIVEKSGLYLFVFGGQIAVRFKKFGENLTTSNQPSRQVQEFKNQIQLPGVQAAHNLESGYILSADAQSLAAVHLVCPSGTGVYWDVVLTADSQTGVVQDLFAKKIDSEEPNEGAKIKRRDTAKIIQITKNGDES
jgi:hypothetical protein